MSTTAAPARHVMTLAAPVIYGLLLSVLMVSAPHAEHLPPWVTALSAMALLWRAYLARTGRALPRPWLLALLAVATVGALLIQYHTLLGQEAGVTLLITLTSLKVLELRGLRDATVVIYLSLFDIITNFFYSQSIPTALYMLVTLLVIMSTWLRLYGAPSPLRLRLRTAGMLLLQGIPLMLVLFVLFPRVQGPLWSLPQDDLARTGLSDTMSPDSISRLSQSDEIAMRITFKGAAPSRDRMYWRGPVLTDYDGISWHAAKGLFSSQPRIEPVSGQTEYTVMLEPHYKTWLFALEMPEYISIRAAMTNDFQLRQRQRVSSRMQYQVRSSLDYRANVQEDPFQLRRALQLPAGIDPRARELAERWRTTYRNDHNTIMLAALRHFNQQGFVYTLEPPPLGANAIDDFLFRTRQGFCEHYASAFVFLMRAAGVPARVVTGYQGGEFNELGNYFIVRQSDAHAWAEVWLQGRGWVRVDPTAAVSPARVQNGLAAALPNSAAVPLLARPSSAWLLRLRFNLDLIAYQWNEWVLGYDTDRQQSLLSRLGMTDITWRKMALYLVGLLAALVGLFALLMLRRHYARRKDPSQRLYDAFCRTLGQAGLQRAAHEGPQDFAQRTCLALPQLAAEINDITAQYVALRYGPADDSDRLPSLQRAVRAFKL